MSFVREVHKVEDEFDGLRFQEYAPSVFELLPSRAGAKKAIKRGELLIDGEVAQTARIMRTGMVIELIEGVLPASRLYRLELPILFEDEYLAVVHKPAGVSVSGNEFKTVQNALAGVLSRSILPDALPRFLPVHRLDNLTSGLLIIAKTTTSRIALGALFEDKKIHKQYHAIVVGKTESFGEMTSAIEGKQSRTTYERISQTDSLKSGVLSLLRLTPHTGRTHQLRIHCAERGFPIAGDTLYSEKGSTILHKGLFLVATHLSFPHPSTGKIITLTLDLPKKFSRYLVGEQTRFEKYSQ